MSQSLPTPGGDVGTWGTMLNGFLQVSLSSTGTLNSGVVADAQVASGAAINPNKINGTAEVQTNKGAANGYAPLVSSLVPLANLGTGTATTSTFLRGDGSWQAIPSATTSSLGLIELGGDLNGTGTTATAPTLANTTNVQNVVNAIITSNSGTTRSSLGVSALTPAAAVATTNIAATYSANSFAPTTATTIDNYTFASGDLILLTAQTSAVQNGLWLVPSSGAWTRPSEFPTATVVKGHSVVVMNGSINANTQWALDTPTAGITIDTSNQTWSYISVPIGSNSLTTDAFQDTTELPGRAGAASVPVGSLNGTTRQPIVDVAIGDSIIAGTGSLAGVTDFMTVLATIENRQNGLPDPGVGFVTPGGGGEGKPWGALTGGAVSTTITVSSVTLTSTSSTTVTASSFPGVFPGQGVTWTSGGGSLAANTYVVSVSGTSLVLSTPPTATSTGNTVLTFSTNWIQTFPTASSWTLSSSGQAIGDGVTSTGALVTVTGVTLTSGSNTATVASGGYPNASQTLFVTGAGIPPNTQVRTISSNTIVFTQNAVATGQTVTATSASGSTLTIPSTSGLVPGMTVTGAGITGTVVIQSVSVFNTLVTLVAQGGSIGTLTASAYVFSTTLNFTRSFRRAQIFYQQVNLGDKVTFNVVGAGTGNPTATVSTANAAGGIGVWDSGVLPASGNGVYATWASGGGGAGAQILGVRYTNSAAGGVSVDNLAYPTTAASSWAANALQGTIVTGWGTWLAMLLSTGNPARRLYVNCGLNDAALSATAANIGSYLTSIAQTANSISPTTEVVMIAEHYGDGATSFTNVTTFSGSPLISSASFGFSGFIPIVENASVIVGPGIPTGATVTGTQGFSQVTVNSCVLNSTTTVTNSGGFSGAATGMLVTGASGIQSATYVQSVGSTTLTLTKTATASTTEALTFTPTLTLSANATATGTNVILTQIYGRQGPVYWQGVVDAIEAAAQATSSTFINMFAVDGDISPHAMVTNGSTTSGSTSMTVSSGGFPGVVAGLLPYLASGAGGIFSPGTLVKSVSGNTVTLTAPAVGTISNTTFTFLADTQGISSGGLHYGDYYQSPSGRDGMRMVAEAIAQRLAYSRYIPPIGTMQTNIPGDGAIIASLPYNLDAAGVSWSGYANSTDTQPQWALRTGLGFSPGLYLGGGGQSLTDTNIQRTAASTLAINNGFTTNFGTYNNNAVTVTSNAGTCPVTFKLNTFTNSSAATMAITIATTNAVDGQMMIVRIYDFSAVAQTIGWTNTENSNISVPGTSNGSTTTPLTVGFMYNAATSKWRCIAVS